MENSIDLRKQEITERSSGTYRASPAVDANGLRLAWHTSRHTDLPELVLLEPKDYASNPDNKAGSKVYDRIKELARVLHGFEPAADSNSHLLKCKGWYDDQATAQFYFVYHLPPECVAIPSSLSSGNGIEFISLFEAYNTSHPLAGDRVRLALALARTLLDIHKKNWLHKGLRSDHIIFFPARLGGRPNLTCPRVVGFDYARRDGPNEYSEKPIDKHLNLYRHPDALRDPTTAFRRLHDYYSLGIVMVEIACWKPLAKLLAKRSELKGKECLEEDIKRVREILKEYDSPGSLADVGFRLGIIYRDVVDVCLNGSFGVSDDDPDRLHESFRQRVIRELDRCVL